MKLSILDKLFPDLNLKILSAFLLSSILIAVIFYFGYQQIFNSDSASDQENIQRLKQWSQNKSDLNSYQLDIVHHYLNIKKRPFSSASWTVVEPNCHFTK